MPRVTPTAYEAQRNEISFRIRDLMLRSGYDNEKMSQICRMSVRTFISKKMHKPDEFTVAEIWAMERAFGCRISEPLRKEA